MQFDFHGPAALGDDLLRIKVLPSDLAANGGAVGIITLKNRTLPLAAQLFIDRARGGKANGNARTPADSGLSDGYRR
jgi:hypothetical protein